MGQILPMRLERIPSRIDPLTLPLEPDTEAGWRAYDQYKGTTDNAAFLSCHVSVLVEGHTPHPPHTHEEEEILLMLAGEADLILPRMRSREGGQGLRLKPGQFVYYPAHFPHTLRGASPEPATYLMFKWAARVRRTNAQLEFGHFDAGESRFRGTSGPAFDYQLLFEGPTGCLEKLHAHVTKLAPGTDNEPHTHRYETAMVVLDGEIETLGRRVRPHGLVYYAGRVPHGIRNPGGEPARYVVFEFHGHPRFWRNVADRSHWARRLRAMWRFR
jgi:mannose-6-phosphate isomerase-like protein (cupin superfamily)